MLIRMPCYYCDGKASTKDHRFPIARGGDNDAFNMVPACAECNHLKDIMTQGEFLEFCKSLLIRHSPSQDKHRGRARIILSRLAPDMIPEERTISKGEK